MKNDSNKQAKEFPVREGEENSSILYDKKPLAKDKYPQPEEKDKQAKINLSLQKNSLTGKVPILPLLQNNKN